MALKVLRNAEYQSLIPYLKSIYTDNLFLAREGAHIGRCFFDGLAWAPDLFEAEMPCWQKVLLFTPRVLHSTCLGQNKIFLMS